MKLPHMPLWVYDIQADEACSLFTLEQFGAYMKLLIHQWIEGSIPSDPQDIAHLLRVKASRFEAVVWKAVRAKFAPAGGDGRLQNARLASEREEVVAKVERLAANGAKGGRPKKQLLNQMDKQNESNSKPEGSTHAYGSDSVSNSSPSADELKLARDAVEAWSMSSRGHGLSSSEDDDVTRRLIAMPDDCRMLPEAVNDCRRSGTEFKRVAYAMTSALNRVDEKRKASSSKPGIASPLAIYNRCKTSVQFAGETAPKSELGHSEQGIHRNRKLWIPAARLGEAVVA